MTTGFVAYDDLQAKYEDLLESHNNLLALVEALVAAKANAGLNVNHTRRAEFLKLEQVAWEAAKQMIEESPNGRSY